MSFGQYKVSKGKVHPRTDHEGPEWEYRYSYTLSLTSTLDGVGGQHHVPTALPLGKRSGAHFMGDWVSPKAGLRYPGPASDNKSGLNSPVV